MQQPRQWTLDELEIDAAHAAEAFRRQRLDEPLGLYTNFFEAFCPIFRSLVGQLPGLRRDERAGVQIVPARVVEDRLAVTGSRIESVEAIRRASACRTT